MADALVSPVVAGVAGLVAVTLIGVASKKVSKIERTDIVPLMGVMGAFVFAAQMINFSIPGTGSSGHIIGGILLAALLGPWAAFIVLSSVLIIQCLIFADGGLMALGCNIVNMGVTSCLIAAPLIYRSVTGVSLKKWRIWVGSILSSIVALELGALLVTVETKLSGVSALPFDRFLELMSSIHLAIGACEGVATAIILSFIVSYQPGMLYSVSSQDKEIRPDGKKRGLRAMLAIGILAIVLAGGFTWLASSFPDGLEWSIAKITGHTELGEASIPSTALMPDYDSTFSGIIGGVIVMVMLWAVSAIIFRRRRMEAKRL